MCSLFTQTLENISYGFLPAKRSYSYDFSKNELTKRDVAAYEKVQHYAWNFFKVIGYSIALPMVGTLFFLNHLKHKTILLLHFSKQTKSIEPIEEEEMVRKLTSKVKKVGFSDSFFQSCGMGTDSSTPEFSGRCDWSEWVEEPKGHIESSREQIAASFRNYLDDPTSFIQLLKEMRVTAYRFSLERAVIEPKKGSYDELALQKHIEFCKALKRENIEPWITLNHFVQPKWFADDGGFSREENVSNFVLYCEKIITKFKEKSGVIHWMTFNELGADVFQRDMRRVYPGKKSGIFAAMTNMKHMLIAHFALYQKIKQKYPEIQIGITHQWLKMVPANPYNPIERIACWALSLMTHYALFHCYKSGILQMPFIVNDRIWTQEKPPMDFIGIQSYGFPVLKVGFGLGKEPGQVIKLKIPLLNRYFVAGATCKEVGGKVSSFGPPYSPDDLEVVLQEAKELKVPLAITETGCDAKLQAWGKETAKLDEQTQKEYFQKMFSILTRFQLEGLFIWTLFKNQLEWENGTEKTCLGVISDEKDDKTAKIKSWKLSPAAEYIQSIFKKMISQAHQQVA